MRYPTSFRRILVAKCIIFLQNMQFKFFQGFVVSLEMAMIVPTHCVDICLGYFISQLRVMIRHKQEQFFHPEKAHLLDVLGV